MHTIMRRAAVVISCVALMYSATVHALADATAAPVPASGNSPVPVDWLGWPLACDKFLPSNVWRPNGDRATLISVHITAQGELRHAVLFKSSGDGNLDAAALACVPTLHLSVTQNGAPADIVWWWEFIGTRIGRISAFQSWSPRRRPTSRITPRIWRALSIIAGTWT